MVELNVQPKKSSPVIWIVLIVIALALLFFLIRGCGDTKTGGIPVDTIAKDTIATTVPDWDAVDFNSPDTSYDEVTDKGVIIRSNAAYTIYGIGENVLFAKDESAIQANAATRLQQISASLKKRFEGASLAVYGHTDATGTAAHNKQLGADRAAAVKNWLVAHDFAADKISIQSKGETDPASSNATAQGKELNRNVEIVAMASKK